MTSCRHVFLIDASGFIFRAFHALPAMHRPDGTPVNAVRGFCSMIMKVIGETDADHIACVFDHGSRSFRNDIYALYKAHRPDTPEDLVPQFPLIREAARAFNLPVVEMEGYEADDIIATYARIASEAGARTTIVSSDKDLMQLVSDQVTMRDGMKDRLIGADEVMEKFGVLPDKVVDVQALAGDSVDNVPGVPGIGIKTAATLVNEYGDLESLLGRAHEITQPRRRENLLEHADNARMSLRLVTLERHVPRLAPLENLSRQEPNADRLMAFLQSQNFQTLRIRAAAWMGERAGTGVPAVPDTVSYDLVQDMADLERWAVEASRQGFVAIDTETTSLDAITAQLVGISLSLSPGAGCYIPLAHRSSELMLETPQQLTLEAVREVLGPLLADPGVLKIGHNIKYDGHMLARAGMPVSPVDDTMLLSWCLDAGRRRHSVDVLASDHLGREVIAFKDVAGRGKSQVTFDLVPLDRARDYAAQDAEVTLCLWQHLRPRLVPERITRVYETIERPLIGVLAAMERAGIKVDRDKLQRLSGEFGRRIQDLEGTIHALAGRSFPIGSPKQLGEILFDEMGLPDGRKRSTGADVLESLAALGHELPARVLEWRQLSKLKSTYTDTLVEQINVATNRVHTSFSMVSAPTGRLASTDPNLQNIPVRTEEGRRIRSAFVGEPGHLLMSADYSQIELRLLAHIADIASLKEAFHNGIDIHAMTASEVFHVPLEGMDPLTRRNAKAINFGIIYGISAFGLARQLAIGRDEARAYIDAYFERYPGIREYMDRTIEAAREQGHVTTLFGRKCHLPEIRNARGSVRAYNERAAINAPLQGSAADVIKRAMIRLPDALEAKGLKGRMLLQVHDELLFEVPEDETGATAECVRRVMENAAHLDVPLTVDIGLGADWNAAH